MHPTLWHLKQLTLVRVMGDLLPAQLRDLPVHSELFSLEQIYRKPGE